MRSAVRLSLSLNASRSIFSEVIKSWANRPTQRFAEEEKGRLPGLDETLARCRLRCWMRPNASKT
jgi:hypothetical protein